MTFNVCLASQILVVATTKHTYLLQEIGERERAEGDFLSLEDNLDSINDLKFTTN